MPQPIRKGPFWICRKTGKIVGLELKSRWLTLFLPLTGFFALLWYLVRVLPKPDRAAYPCQRAAAPLAAGFVGYLLALPVAVMAFRKGRRNLWRTRYALAAVCFLISAVAGLVSLSTNTKDIHAAFISTDGPNSPMGAGKGVFPGRVAWVFDPTAASWGGSGNWWDDAWNNQTAIDGMMSQCVRCVGGQVTDAASWDALFRSFNQRRGKGNVGYAAGEKFAIKINMNNNGSQAANNNINASPHMVLALLKQLVNQASVAQSNITVFDASRFIPDNIYNKCHAQFPGVVFVDNVGGNGRVQSTYVTNAIPFSVASSNQKDLAACVVQASYVINLALLKGHVNQGVTLCGKNFFGATGINADYTKNNAYHNYFTGSGTPSYMTFTDYLGHKDLGGKTILFMMDGLYASQTVGGAPNQKWQMTPFNNRWPSSLFVSEDGVAVDSVALDFLRSEWPNMADMAYCDMYLHEAALANNPPSHTVYKPDGVTVLTNSLGVHEHWNNATNKQYSRNLGASGTGIELIALQPGLGISVAITNPVSGAAFSAGANIMLQATLASTSAPISKVEFYRSGALIGTSTSSPYNVLWSNAPVGEWSLTAVATDTNNFSGISPAVNITVQTNLQPVQTLAYVQQPGNTLLGTPITPAVQVEAFGTNGQPVSAAAITLTLASGTGTLGGTLTQYTDANGIAHFNDLSVYQAGPKMLTATAGIGTAPPTNSSLFIIIGPVAGLAFTTQPGAAVAGAPFGQQPVLRTVDQFSTPTTTGLPATLIVNVALTNGSGTLRGTTNYNLGTAGSNGVVTFTDLEIDTAGSGFQLLASLAGTPSNSVPGAVLWLDASDPATLTTNATKVQAWKNKGSSGAGTTGTNFWLTQNTVANQPTLTYNGLNGKPVVTFNGSSTYLTNLTRSYTNGGGQMTYFSVDRMAANTLMWRGPVSFSTNGQRDGWGVAGVVILTDGSQASPYPLTIQRAHQGGPLQAPIPVPAVGTAFVMTYVDNFGAAGLYYTDASGNYQTNVANVVNGVSPYTYGITDVAVGGRFEPDPTISPNLWSGDIAEVLVYNTALSVADRTAVETYLKGKWFGSGLALSNALSVPFTVQTPGGNPPRQKISWVTLNNAGALTFTYATTPGYDYHVEMASNLVSPQWEIISGSATSAVGATVTFTAPVPAGADQRYYRTVSP